MENNQLLTKVAPIVVKSDKRIVYNSQLEDTLKEFKLLTSPGVAVNNIHLKNSSKPKHWFKFRP